MVSRSNILIATSESADPLLVKFLMRQLRFREICCELVDAKRVAGDHERMRVALAARAAVILVCTGEASIPEGLCEVAQLGRETGLPLIWCLKGLREEDIPAVLRNDPRDRVVVVMDDESAHLSLTDLAQSVESAMEDKSIPPEILETFQSLMRETEVDETHAESLLAAMESAGAAIKVCHEFQSLHRRALLRLGGLWTKLLNLLMPRILAGEGKACASMIDRWQTLCDEAPEFEGALRARLIRLIIALNEHSAGSVLDVMESAWKFVADPDEKSVCFELAPRIKTLTEAAFSEVYSESLKKAEANEWEVARAWCERAAALTREMGEDGECAVAMSFAAMYLGSQETHGQEGVWTMEQALRLGAKAGSARESTLITTSAENLYRNLSVRTEQLIDRRAAGAADNTRALVRLARAMRGQARLTEALACASVLATDSQQRARLAYEARALAEVHDLPDVAAAVKELAGDWHPLRTTKS